MMTQRVFTIARITQLNNAFNDHKTLINTLISLPLVTGLVYLLYLV